MGSETKLWDVVIAGGGLVGMSLGLALAQGGLSVAICDPIAPPEMTDERFDGRVSALAFSCIRMFRVLGLWPGLEAHAQPINDILVSDGAPARKTSPLTLHFDHREIGEVLGYIVENRHTRIALFEAIARQQGIALFSGVAGQAAETQEGFATLVLSDGRRLNGRLVIEIGRAHV